MHYIFYFRLVQEAEQKAFISLLDMAWSTISYIAIIIVYKTEKIANIIIINSQNVKSEHLLPVIITSVFKEESSVSAWTSSTEVANTGLPKLPLG